MWVQTLATWVNNIQSGSTEMVLSEKH